MCVYGKNILPISWLGRSKGSEPLGQSAVVGTQLQTQVTVRLAPSLTFDLVFVGTVYSRSVPCAPLRAAVVCYRSIFMPEPKGEKLGNVPVILCF